jgi:drug/metabolite transporter (DMT)-like permease
MAKGGGGRHPLAGPFLIAVGGAATALPLLLVTGLPAVESWIYVALSGVIHVAYFGLIARAYRLADYSAIYPLIRGGAPLVTSLIAALWLGEVLSGPALAGVVLLSAGIAGLSVDGLRRGHLDRRSLATAGLTAGVVVSYTLLDGLGARVSGNAVAYLLAMSIVSGVLVVPLFLALAGRALLAEAHRSWKRGILGGGMANLSYGTALWAMTQAPIGLVGAVRETSVLFATLIGAVVLKERFGPARWAAALTIVAGLTLVRLS